MVSPPFGRVELSHKKKPLFECSVESEPEIEPNCAPYIFKIGCLNVESIKSQITSKGRNLWDESSHARTNVRIIRPSHDSWGVEKAVFVYCDDFIRKVYRFPWFEEWKHLLLPVFEAINVDQNRVVRCLLASMPPGCEIPTHHDTGFWVRHTHRIHVPLITCPERVCFRVGRAPSEMEKFELEQNSIYELNNQAKHAVKNNWNTNRVHLIFDYVDDFPLREIICLNPRTVLTQTRRSIDVVESGGETMENDFRSDQPTFIVIGAMKSGTTSLYNYLVQHPLIVEGNRRETHFFDWNFPCHLKTIQQQRQFYMKFFKQSLLSKHRSLMTGESTPSYMIYSNRVIPRIKAISPHSKILAILRDPVKRAYSHYNMERMKAGTKNFEEQVYSNVPFEEAVQKDLEALKGFGIDQSSTSAEFIEKYVKKMPDKPSHSLIARGLYALLLEPWLAAFSESQIKVIFLDDFQNNSVDAVMGEIHEFIGVPHEPIKNKEPFHVREYKEPMNPQTMEMLRGFYEPFDEKLEKLLKRPLPWKNVS